MPVRRWSGLYRVGVEALGAAALTAGLCWAILALLSGGGSAAGEIGGFLSTDLAGIAAAVAASTGAPVDWTVAGLGGRLYPISFLLAGSPLALLVAGPLAGAAVLGLRTRAMLERGGHAAGVAVAAATYAAALVSFAAVGTSVAADPLVRLAVPALPLAAAALLWAFAGILAVNVLSGQPRTAARSRRAAVVAAVVAAGALVAVPASAEPPADRVMPFGGGTSKPRIGYKRPGVATELARLRTEQGAEPLVSNDPWRGTPSMVGTRSRLDGGVPTWMNRHAGIFGLADPAKSLRPQREQRDPTGERHLWYEQHVGGVPVYGSRVGIHLDRTGQYVEFVTNGAEPALKVESTQATVPAGDALRTARLAMPNGRLVEPAKLYLLPSNPAPDQATPTVLAWRVWLTDLSEGLSNAYFVDARSGRLVYAMPQAAHARDRRIYDANKLTELPIVPKRTEGEAATGIDDVDEAYDYLGATYDYYFSEFGRDSYNGTGGDLRAFVRVRSKKDEPMRNAAFIPDDIDTMVFGEGMTKVDVVAHELTHGVTFNSAGLWYMYQSGALNESFSDIFGERIENYAKGAHDWLVGGQIPGGALRSMADPNLYGDPAHYVDFRSSCSDWGGVHTNSGIQNQAFYLLSQQIGITKAAQIAYKTLTTYLGERARFTDSRVGFIESANKLFGKNSTEAKETAAAWSAVGVDGIFEQPRQDCACFADESLAGAGVDGLDPQGPGVDAVLAALLHVRDLFSAARTPALAYYEVVYVTYGQRAIELMTADDELRRRTAHAMQTLEPALRSVGTADGDSTVVSQDMLDELNGLMNDYAAADVAAGGGGLAERIGQELDRAAFDQLAGKTVNQALAFLDTRVG
jgi:Zn-dependent metalloprotease